MEPQTARIEVHLHPDELDDALRSDVRVGLGNGAKWLPPKWFYDEAGSILFDEITRLDEYYPTRTERSILVANANEIIAKARCDTLVELGSGTSEKTRVLLDALCESADDPGYVSFDVSEEVLRESAQALVSEYPGMPVHGIVGDFDHHLGFLPRNGRRMLVLLGSTLGNFGPKARHDFLCEIAAGLDDDESLLLGLDLVKPAERLVAAYDDAGGVTAAFNRNVLAVLNDKLGADFDPQAFAHVAVWDEASECIEMRLRATRPLTAQISALGLEVAFEAGEDLHTETCAKFRRETFEEELSGAGLGLARWWTDANADFALALCSPAIATS